MGTRILFWFLLMVLPILTTCKKRGGTGEKLSPGQQREITRIFMDHKIEKLSELLHHSHRYYKFNGSILVAYDGEVIFNDYNGYADFINDDTLKAHSAYQLASVSKQFTAMAIMMLEEMDSLGYEDKMVQHVPELKSQRIHYYDSISIKHLLNHTSGLPNYMYYVERYTHDTAHPYNDEIVRLMAQHKQFLNFKPGTRF